MKPQLAESLEASDRAVDRPPISEELWDWRGTRAARRREQERASIRKRGGIVALAGLVGGLIAARFSSFLAAGVIWGICSVLAVSALAGPTKIFLWVERGIGWFVGRVGRFSNFLLLTPIYYLFFLPRGIYLRLTGKDPMERRFEPSRDSYWKPRNDGKRPVADYGRGF